MDWERTFDLHARDARSTAVVPSCLVEPRPVSLAREELLNRCLGDIEFAHRLVGRYRDRFERDAHSLRRCHRDRDAVELARVAHRLKGAAATVAAHGLRETFALIEKHARQHNWDEVPACFDKLDEEWSRFCQHAAEMISPSPVEGAG